MKTTHLRPPAPQWLLLNADGANLGRLAARAALFLRGKHRPIYSPHQLCGDHVVVVNVDKLSFEPSKLRRKTYVHHTGFLGSLRRTRLSTMIREKPEFVLAHAVSGMLPKNRLRPRMLRRLHIHRGAEHPYSAQKPVPTPLS